MPTLNKPKKKQHIFQPYKHTRQSAPYYNTKLWRNLRDTYLRDNPLCECCRDHYDKVTPATEVHHKIPFLRGRTEEERTELLLDDTNLMSVCRECHLEIHNNKIPEYKMKNT